MTREIFFFMQIKLFSDQSLFGHKQINEAHCGINTQRICMRNIFLVKSQYFFPQKSFKNVCIFNSLNCLYNCLHVLTYCSFYHFDTLTIYLCRVLSITTWTERGGEGVSRRSKISHMAKGTFVKCPNCPLERGGVKIW